jgi:hypothetical protein
MDLTDDLSATDELISRSIRELADEVSRQRIQLRHGHTVDDTCLLASFYHTDDQHSYEVRTSWLYKEACQCEES